MSYLPGSYELAEKQRIQQLESEIGNAFLKHDFIQKLWFNINQEARKLADEIQNKEIDAPKKEKDHKEANEKINNFVHIIKGIMAAELENKEFTDFTLALPELIQPEMQEMRNELGDDYFYKNHFRSWVYPYGTLKYFVNNFLPQLVYSLGLLSRAINENVNGDKEQSKAWKICQNSFKCLAEQYNDLVDSLINSLKTRPKFKYILPILCEERMKINLNSSVIRFNLTTNNDGKQIYIVDHPTLDSFPTKLAELDGIPASTTSTPSKVSLVAAPKAGTKGSSITHTNDGESVPAARKACSIQ